MATATTGTTPAWYNDYLREIASVGEALGTEEYQNYQGPRIAEWTPDQQEAFARTRDAADMWRPYADQAEGMLGQAQGGLEAMSTMTQQAGQFNRPTYDNTYLDIYQPAMTGMQNSIDQIGQRNFQNTTLQQLNDNFTGSGQFGSGRHQILGADAAAMAQSQIEEQKANVEMTGRQNAMSDYMNWAKQTGAMGNQMGNYATNQAGMGANLMNFGTNTQNLANQSAAAIGNIGSQQQEMNQKNLNLSYQDYMDQQAYPWQQLSRMTQAVQGNAIPTYGSNVQQVQTTNPWLAGATGGLGAWQIMNPTTKTTTTA